VSSGAPSSPEVVVFGSLNMDLVGRVPRMPAAGETLTGRSFMTNPGGKGANQAVACARQGARVRMVGKVGADAFGAQLRGGLERDGIAIDGVASIDASTGVAMIMVDDRAQNCIAVIPGANAQVGVAEAEGLRECLGPGSMLVLQLEVPMAAVLRAAQVAREAGATVVLNPAPAQALPEPLWPLVDMLVLNETEAGLLGGLEAVDAANAPAAASLLRQRGPRHVIITLGEHGLVWSCAEGTRRFDAVRVQPVDTTAAGDTFIGAMCALLAQGRPMAQALAHANRAAALCVTRPGAQASIPTRAEVEAFAA